MHIHVSNCFLNQLRKEWIRNRYLCDLQSHKYFYYCYLCGCVYLRVCVAFHVCAFTSWCACAVVCICVQVCVYICVSMCHCM
jgi:hypothetical protein